MRAAIPVRNLMQLGRAFALLLFTIALGAPQTKATPQGDSTAKQQKIAALKESLARNQAALKQYTWTETTQISLKGEVKKQEQKQCHYGPDGKVQKVSIGPAAPAPEQASGRRGRLKEHVVEKKVGELKDYMQSVSALIQEYVPPDPQKIQAAYAAGNVSVTPMTGVLNLVIKNYVQPQDSVTLGFGMAAKKISSYNVQSYLGETKDAVTLNVTFATLPDGTNYPQKTVLDATAKQIQVTTTNSNYTKLSQ
jgi:hypothetical protein